MWVKNLKIKSSGLSPMTSMLIRDTKKRDMQRCEAYMKTEVKTGVTQAAKSA